MKANKLVVVVCALCVAGGVQAAPGLGGASVDKASAADKEIQAIAAELEKSGAALSPGEVYATLLKSIDPDAWSKDILTTPNLPSLVVGSSAKPLVIGPDPTILRPVDGSDIDLPIGVGSKPPVRVPDMPACAAGAVAGAPTLSASERAALARVEQATGRLATRGHSKEDFLGTAWVAGDGLVVTARHVVENFLGPASNGFRMVDGAHLVFELQDPTAVGGWRVYDVSPVPRSVSGDADLAVLGVEASGGGPAALPPAAPRASVGWALALSRAGQQALGAQRLAVVGYPSAAQTRNRSRTSNPAEPKKYWIASSCAYGGVFDVRRTSFGSVRLVAALSDEAHVILHGATTVPGVSGGPVVDLASGAVVAITTCEPLMANANDACVHLGRGSAHILDDSQALQSSNLAWSVDALPSPL